MRLLSILSVCLLAACVSGSKTEPTSSTTPAAPVRRPAPQSPPPPKPVAKPQQEPKVSATEILMQDDMVTGSAVGAAKADKPYKKKDKEIKLSADPIIAQLFKASMAFVVPDSTNITEDIKAQLLIDPSVDDVSKQLTIKGTITKSNIQISKIAIAKLTAPEFEVTPITPEQQALTTSEPTEWLWELQPKSAGKHDINLTITAVVKIDGDKSEHHLKTFEKTVTVEITTMQVIKAWFNKYWQWIVSTLIVPLGVWVYKEKIKKKD